MTILFKAPNFNDLDVERYGPICSMMGKHLFASSNLLQSEALIRNCFSHLAKRLNTISFDSKYFFALGDAYFEEADMSTHQPETHKEAIK